MSETATKPSAGALRAAEVIEGTVDDLTFHSLPDADGATEGRIKNFAQIIDRESGLAEAVEALRLLVSFRAIGPSDSAWTRAREALAKIEGRDT